MEEETKMKNEQEFYAMPRDCKLTLKTIYIVRNACENQAELLQTDIDKLVAKADRLRGVVTQFNAMIDKLENKKAIELGLCETSNEMPPPPQLKHNAPQLDDDADIFVQ
jgi:hypothetical protein